MTKVGHTSTSEVDRLEQHMRDCRIQFQRMYQHPGFQGARRAEQIVLRLLRPFNYEMYSCACRRGSHVEWVSKAFVDVVTTIQVVSNWMQYQEPYDFSNGELKEEWKESLSQWYGTQRTRSPLEWTMFFLRHTLYWRDYPIHLSYRQRVEQQLVYSPTAPDPKTPKSERHRPTGYFELTPIEDHEHKEMHQQSLEVESVNYPSGKMVSKIKEEQMSYSQDTYTLTGATSNTADGDVFDTRTSDRQDSKGPGTKYKSKASEKDNEEVQSCIDGENDDSKQIFDADDHDDDSIADDTATNDYDSPVPKYKKPPNRNTRSGGRAGNRGGLTLHHSPEPQSDDHSNHSDDGAAPGSEGSDFTAPKLMRRTTMTDDVKAGASKVIGKVKKAGRQLRELPNVKPKKKK